MRITKVPNKDDINFLNKQKALRNCNVCPYCGKNVNSDYVFIPVLRTEYVKTGIFKKERVKVSEFECKSCGAQWESDPYK